MSAVMARLNGLARRDRLDRLAPDLDRLDLVRILSLLFFLLRTQDFIENPVQVLAIAGLVWRPVRRHWALWAGLFALHLVGDLPFRWSSMDNHEWLAVWWLLAMAGASLSDEPLAALRDPTRVMLGLVFLFAVAWKATTPDFPNGDFFEYVLVADDRLAVVADVVGGLPADEVEANRALVDELREPGGPDRVTLATGPRVAVVADVLVWGTFLLEGAVALAFLAPVRGPTTARLRRWRDPLLLGFLVATYPLAPVVSFAWVLLAMGLAQSDLRRPTAEVSHALLFVGLHLIDQGSVVWDVVGKLT